MKPKTRQELKEYALRNLGHPVITINVDDAQLEDRLDDAFQLYAEFHADGYQKVYLPHILTADDIQNQYINIENIDDHLIQIQRVQVSSGAIFSGNIFDLRYQLSLHDFYGLRSGGTFTHYTIMKQHIAMMDLLLNPEYRIRYTRNTGKLYIDGAWNRFNEGDILLIEGHSYIDVKEHPKIYDDIFLKKYVTALFKRQWGANLMKFTGLQLPGGVEFNGRQIYEDAVQEIEKIETELRETWEFPINFIVG